ncbi:MAG TPA: recombinase family protein, partial [Trichococcus flocculiformis]|nr:recombinase family protein [Trichococcus flocculiformis]
MSVTMDDSIKRWTAKRKTARVIEIIQGKTTVAEARGPVWMPIDKKASGAQRGRPELARMLDHLQPGNVVAVTRLDRLARSTRDLLDIAERIGQAEAGLRSLAEPWADTTTPAGRMVLT